MNMTAEEDILRVRQTRKIGPELLVHNHSPKTGRLPDSRVQSLHIRISRWQQFSKRKYLNKMIEYVTTYDIGMYSIIIPR